MSSLAAISFTLVGGIIVFSGTIFGFGVAMKTRSTFIAARCEARPRNVIFNPNPKHPCQYRGNPTLGWIFWVMRLTYETMLRGVPGTGTRDGGLSGSLLKVNLDGIVLLRFHHLCLRVCSLAMILYLLVILPSYATARCSRIGGDYYSENCTRPVYNLTDYERLTLANIPTLEVEREATAKGVFRSFFDPVHNGNLARLYATVFVSWIVTWYAMHQLRKEWVDVLALRRVYYLEADHWQDRKQELQETLLSEEFDKKTHTKKDIHMIRRQPYIPHPEQRDTVPNVALYSMLVGGLPSLPTEVVDRDEVEAVFSKKQSTDWQLSVATAFFDHCVPNQPGFSSSIAAITILPAASHLAEAWKNWYKAAAKLRRLRYIRRQIADRRRFEIDTDAYPEDADPEGIPLQEQAPIQKSSEIDSRKNASVYERSDAKDMYYHQVLGSVDDIEVENNLLHAMNFGPEQTAVYSREFAQGAATLAPNGFCEDRIKRASIDELLDMERVALEAVHEANLQLRETQERIADDSNHSQIDLMDGDVEAIMMRASNHDMSFTSLRIDDDDDGDSSADSFADDDSDSDFAFYQDDDEYELSLNEPPEAPKMPSRSAFGTTGSSHDSSSQGAREYVGSLNDTDADMEKPTRGRTVSRWRTRSSMSRSRSRSRSRSISRSVSTSSSRSGSSSVRGKPGFSKFRDVVSAPLRTMSGSFPRRAASGSGFANEKRRMSSAELNNCELPQDLGLEAGLWMEQQKRSSLHGSRHASRHGRPSRQKSAPVPAVESGGNDLVQMQAGLKRVKEADRKESFQRRDKSAPIKAKARSSKSSMPPSRQTNVDDSSSKPVLQDSQTFWEKIEQEQKRKENVLSSLQRKSLGSNDSPRNAESWGDDDDGDVITPLPNASNNQRKATNILPRIHDDSSSSYDMDGLHAKSSSLRAVSHAILEPEENTQNLRISYDFEMKAGLRQRETFAEAHHRSHAEKWNKVEQIVKEASSNGKERKISRGNWQVPTPALMVHYVKTRLVKILHWFLKSRRKEVVDELARDSTFAVVTFTSRQAAVAARHCLADSRGADRWTTVSAIPVPPLADAAVFNIKNTRGCARPVAISINDKQKLLRHQLSFLSDAIACLLRALAALVSIYFFYTIPLVAAQALVQPENLANIIPDILTWQENSEFVANIFSGLVPALVWSGFFAVCPIIFKLIANFGSNATSVVEAENSALNYFWWFMVLAAFSGTSLTTAVINGFNDGIQIGSEIQEAIESTAASIPSLVSATWLNWMIVRFLIILPTQYLLQLNSFVLTCLGLRVCARAVRGGGSGPPIPYRIYVDSGVVMLCVFALAPASPLIAPTAFCYYLFCAPMLRWTMIFLYRPKFDIGGGRFPFIFDMCVSGMIVGQILLVAMLSLLRAAGPALFAGIPIIPTIAYRYILRRRFLPAFSDVALLQSSLLDGWDTNEETSMSKREEFRKFLVDSHKAAYVPVCIASEDTMTTAEPAVVLPCENDEDFDLENGSVYAAPRGLSTAETQGSHTANSQTIEPHHQHGTMLRRASATMAPGTAHLLSPILSPRALSPRKQMKAMDLASPSLTDGSFRSSQVEGLPSSPIL